ncbi:DUF1995 domain-containing protein [Durusdinium trenchii]|uniref:DUF1995 domain-containing protein n=1 Tax=Durusdinium trenchii TaxID=1381693 RepID=A0ABP0MUL1_9DINO
MEPSDRIVHVASVDRVAQLSDAPTPRADAVPQRDWASGTGARHGDGRTTSPERAAAAEVESEVATLPSGLVHVKEWAKMEEVTALENYVDQAQRTVEAGGLFTLAALGFCIFYHLEMRAEHYQEHQMALAARCGIFLPPLMVGAFVSSIRPFPDKLRYRESALDPEDCRNPHIVVKAVQCLVFFCALISCTALAFALQIHAPVPKPLTPSVSVSELKIDHWPLFFYPTGVTGVQEDSLLLTTDFAVARFQLDSNAVAARSKEFGVKFPCGFAVAVHHGRGTLAALWPLGRPKRLPAKMEHQGKLVPVQAPPELGEEFFQRPNFSVADGVHVRYGLEGDLRWIVNVRQGALNGLCLRFEPEGLLRPQDSGIFKEGVLTERWQESLLPDAWPLQRPVYSCVLPMKKALQLALSPCEQRLCYEHHVDVDAVRPKELNQYPPGQGAETLEEVDVAAGGRSPREWWRPQVKIVDPSKVYEAGPLALGLGDF